VSRVDALFANPAGLWAALLAAPLILLFLLRHRPVRRRVPAIVLWQGAAQMQVATSPFQRLRRSLSLLLLLLALAALVLALAGLRIPGASSRATPLVLVVDITASMQAAVPGGTRLDTARARALETLNAAGNAPVTVLAWDGNLRPASPPASDVARARAGIEALAAVDYGASDGALARALRKLVESDPARRVVLVSDHAPGTLEPPIVFVPAAGAQPNTGFVAAALTEVSARRHELFFGLEHFGPQGVTVAVRIERVTPDGAELLDARDVALRPGTRAAVTVPVRDPGLYRAVLRTPDALALDDTAWVRFARLPVQDVAFVGRPPEPLARAVRAIEAGSGTVRLVESPGPDSMVVFCEGAGLEPRLPAVYLLPAAAPPQTVPGDAAAAAEAPARPARHPLWRGAGVPDIRVPRVVPVSTPRLLTPLLEAGPGPALALARRPDESRLDDLLVCFPLTDEAAGFASRLAFVIFWENWFESGRALRDALPRGAFSTRDSAEILALSGRGAFEYRLRGAENAQGARPGDGLRLENAGLYEFSGLAECDPPLLGVSLLDAEESDLWRAPPPEYDAGAVAAQLAALDTAGESGDLDLRPYLALLAAALVLAEWFLFRRRFPVIAPPQRPRPASGGRHTTKVRA
jgi:hypothetical protein